MHPPLAHVSGTMVEPLTAPGEGVLRTQGEEMPNSRKLLRSTGGEAGQ